MIYHPRRLSILTLAISIGLSSTASASGVMRDKTASSYLATAGAGHVTDISASAAFNNPAGLTYLTRPELQGNLLLVEDSLNIYDKGSSGTNADFNERRRNTSYGVGLSAGGSLFYGQPLGDDWGVGLALASPAGGSCDYGDNWTGSNFVESADVMAVFALASVGYRINPQWSLGLSAGVSYMTWDMNIDPFPGASESLELDDTEPVWALGLIYQPGDHTRIGLRYVTGVEHNLTGEATLNTPMGTSVFNASLGFNLADVVTLSLEQQLTPDLALFADFEWSNWSDVEETRILHQDGPTVVVERNWQDTWGGAIGLAYQVSPTLTLKIGVAYDESAVTKNDRKIDPPLDRQVTYATGINWKLSDSTEFDIGYQYVDLGDVELNQRVEGFDPIAGMPFTQQIIAESEAHAHIVSLGFTQRF